MIYHVLELVHFMPIQFTDTTRYQQYLLCTYCGVEFNCALCQLSGNKFSMSYISIPLFPSDVKTQYPKGSQIL
jgi:hypothetical protein